MQNLWLIIIVFFLLMFILPVFSKIYFLFDVINNIGTIRIKILFFDIINYKIKVKNNQIIIYSDDDKKEIELELSEKQLRFIKQLTVQLKQKVILKHIMINSTIGLNDAMYTALANGLFNIASTSFLSYVKTQKKSMNFQIINNPTYNQTNLIFATTIRLFISLVDIIYSFLMAFLIIRRNEKYEKV